MREKPKHTPIPLCKIGVLFLRRKRPGFDPEWGKEMEAAARKHLNAMDLDVFIPDEQIVDEASIRHAVEACRGADSDVLVALQTTMSDGRLAPVLGQVWDAPLVLWATPERQEGSMISACSLVGTHMFAATLRQLGRPFEIVHGMPGQEETTRQLDRAVRIAHAVRRVRQGKVTLVGAHAPGFIDMHADPFLLTDTLGVQLQHISLHEFLSGMDDITPDAVADDVKTVLGMGLPLKDVPEADLATASRYYLALSHVLRQPPTDGAQSAMHLLALALRDWPELPNVVGQWPYLAMARLSSKGFAVACEGDVDGAVSCLIAGLLGCDVSTLSDWLEHDEHTITLWHAGNAPLQLCDGPAIARHFNNQKPAVVDATLRPEMPITIFRLWHCDNTYRLMACDARTIPPRREIKGTNGLAEVTDRDVVEWFDVLCHAGMPHHVAIVQGHHADALRRFARQMKINWVR